MRFLNHRVLGLAVLAAIGYIELTSAQIIKHIPHTWICKNQTIHHPDMLNAAMDYCSSKIIRPGACKNICVYQTLGMLDEHFKLDEEKTMTMIRLVLNKKDADEEGAKFLPCGKKLKIDDPDKYCTGNHDFLICTREAIAEVCQVPLGSFGFPDE